MILFTYTAYKKNSIGSESTLNMNVARRKSLQIMKQVYFEGVENLGVAVAFVVKSLSSN